jgi:serine protease
MFSALARAARAAACFLASAFFVGVFHSALIGTPTSLQPPTEAASSVEEVVVQFEPGLSEADRHHILTQAGMTLIRPLRFSQEFYLVRPDQPHSQSVQQIAQQLGQHPGVSIAGPNKRQTHPDFAVIQPEFAPGPTWVPDQSSLTQRAWHLNNELYREGNGPRTDIHALEAWAISHKGAGVQVAVIDSPIQWDHPDLAHQLACYDDPLPNPLPGESCGYDFVEEDGDTRLSRAELAQMNQYLKASFQANDWTLLRTYQDLAHQLGDLPRNEKADHIRAILRHRVSTTFHGTWVAGIIAAQGSNGEGLQGVAPEASLLPVRVFDLDGSTTTARLIEATGYAAARGVDVINLSLGGLLPDEALAHHLMTLLDTDPNLVIVAAAGNHSVDGVGFPAAVPGVLAVGATNLEGQRSSYSDYGAQLDLVAPGGDLRKGSHGGILTTGGTHMAALWKGIQLPDTPWSYGVDPLGKYVQVEGTSFAAPNVAGVVALIRSDDPQRQLNRDQIIDLLKATAEYKALSITQSDQQHYRLQREVGFSTWLGMPWVRPSGIYPSPKPVSAQQYYFGAGLVNAQEALLMLHQLVSEGV